MRVERILILTLALIGSLQMAISAPKPIYKDPTQPVEKRVEDLMSRMSIEEKVGQMSQYVGIDHIKESIKRGKGEVASINDAYGLYKTLSIRDMERMVSEGVIGSFLHVLTLEEANYLQKLAMKSRLQIPLIIGIDAIHGNALVSGTTVYPSSITMASSFDPDAVYTASQQTAKEMRATGSQWTFNPNIDISRDARWGRVGETFGEDTYLVSRMGVATIKGLQGDGELSGESVLACAKHLVGGGVPSNGLNSAPFEISERGLREIHLPPYIAAIQEAGVHTLMMAHNEINGTPCHSSKWLMEDIMRGEMGFGGFIVSDWMDISRIHTLHRVAESLEDAIELSINNGIDMNMHGPEFYHSMLELVASGRVSEERVNEAVERILELKFRLGLFENPVINTKLSKSVLFCEEHQKSALEIAERSIVLLKNEESLLPLDLSKYNKILVTGPNANSASILGDWAFEQPEGNVITILDGIREVAGERVLFADYGTDVRVEDPERIAQIATQAQSADLAIVVVGENSMRYDSGSRRTAGENFDRMEIDLIGMQEELIQQIHASGTPTIVVLVGGRPLGVEWCEQNIPAIVQAWEPGSFGGRAVANILVGNVNPSAKLPITMPRHVGQIEMIYNYKPTQYRQLYKDAPSTPLYPFGYGLSYTTFEISKPQVSRSVVGVDDEFEVSVTVTNSGDRSGAEVVQLYIRDLYSTFTRPVKELKDFARVELSPNESREVKFTITPDKLAYYNQDMEFEVERGKFEIMVGSSSLDKDLKRVIIEVK